MTRNDAERYERESVMRAGGIGIEDQFLPEFSVKEMLTSVLRNAPLAPGDNQGRMRSEPEAPVT